jgi:hypothetical protein
MLIFRISLLLVAMSAAFSANPALPWIASPKTLVWDKVEVKLPSKISARFRIADRLVSVDYERSGELFSSNRRNHFCCFGSNLGSRSVSLEPQETSEYVWDGAASLLRHSATGAEVLVLRVNLFCDGEDPGPKPVFVFSDGFTTLTTAPVFSAATDSAEVQSGKILNLFSKVNETMTPSAISLIFSGALNDQANKLTDK